MDATEYVGRRAERALGLLPAGLVVAAGVDTLAGLVQLWRLTTPSLGIGAPAAAGTLWQRVTVGIGNGYDVTPLAWAGLALAVVAALALAPSGRLPGPGPRARRAAVVVGAALAVLALAALALVVVWAVVSHGEVSFSFQAPGEQDGSRITTEVGTFQTDVWQALVRVSPALVAGVLALGSAALLLRPAPVAPAVPVVPVPAAGPAARPDTASADDHPMVDDDPVAGGPDAARPQVAVRRPEGERAGARGSGGAARFARSLDHPGAGPDLTDHPTDHPTDPLAGWTVGPGVVSDVPFRRPGAASASGATNGDRVHGADGAGTDGTTGAGPTGADGSDDGSSSASRAAPSRPVDPYRRPGR